MKKSYIYLLFALVSLLVSCNKETPFNIKQETGQGQIRKSALGIDLHDEEMVQTRAAEAISLDDFTIKFYKNGSASPAAIYRYGDMPDVVTLDRGTYIVKAEYGEDADAKWNAPYYSGESESFTITPEEITDDIGDIVCRLQNVKVSILFAPILTEQMSEDSYVEVKVADSGSANSPSLKFTKNDQLNGNCGYFHFVEGVSLAATFRGMVEGSSTVQTKTYNEVKKGYHYKITFKLNTQQGEHQGDVVGKLSVDASVTVTDVERNINVEEDEILDDSERPREDDPSIPDNPDDPSNWAGPVVFVEKPLSIPDLSSLEPVDGVLSVNCEQDVTSDTSVVLTFNSNHENGFSEFYANIISDKLTPEELEDVDLSDHIDMVNPEELEGPLTGLGFPVNIGGEKKVTFNITGFMPMLTALGEGDHIFEIHGKDANGEIVVYLKLNVK